MLGRDVSFSALLKPTIATALPCLKFQESRLADIIIGKVGLVNTGHIGGAAQKFGAEAFQNLPTFLPLSPLLLLPFLPLPFSIALAFP